ncbi:MAG: DUF4159 domain-containing protein [Gemmatimonadetes bacterium]|nr:DUF4159 domain-containing protein [Gemmatimonadota bacterium]
MRRTLVALTIVLCAAASLMPPPTAHAQRGGRIPDRFRESFGDPNDFYTPPDWRGNPPYDGRFTFARIKYRGYARWSGREGPGWSHDYPDADVHLMSIMREITAVRPFISAGPIVGGAIVALDDPALFKYPVAYLSEPGGWFPNAAEVLGLRNFMLKGGFVIVDDFGASDWGTFESAMRRVVPELEPIELKGDEPVFDSFFKVDMARLQQADGGGGFGGGFGGGGGRRGGRGEGRRGGSFIGYFEKNDPKRRLIVLAAYGQDIGENWQWSGAGFVPVDVSNEAFKLGVNFIIYALTH